MQGTTGRSKGARSGGSSGMREQADAADWVDTRLAVRSDGVATVLFHSIVWQYLPPATQARRVSGTRCAARGCVSSEAMVDTRRLGRLVAVGVHQRRRPGGGGRSARSAWNSIRRRTPSGSHPPSPAASGDLQGTIWEIPALGGAPRRLLDSVDALSDADYRRDPRPGILLTGDIATMQRLVDGISVSEAADEATGITKRVVTDWFLCGMVLATVLAFAASQENRLEALLADENGSSEPMDLKLGARVVSFDYDPQSVACTAELRRRYFPGDAEWKVEEAYRKRKQDKDEVPVDQFRPGGAEQQQRHARALLGESVQQPLAYYDNNLHPDPDERAAVNQHVVACIDAAALLGSTPAPGLSRAREFAGLRRPGRRELAAFRELRFTPPAEFARVVDEEFRTWARAVQQAKVKLEEVAERLSDGLGRFPRREMSGLGQSDDG